MVPDMELVPDPLVRGADPDPHENATDPHHYLEHLTIVIRTLH